MKLFRHHPFHPCDWLAIVPMIEDGTVCSSLIAGAGGARDPSARVPAMQCHRCNERLPLSARVCFSCGAPVERETEADGLDERPALPAPMRVTVDGAPLRDRPFA